MHISSFTATTPSPLPAIVISLSRPPSFTTLSPPLRFSPSLSLLCSCCHHQSYLNPLLYTCAPFFFTSTSRFSSPTLLFALVLSFPSTYPPPPPLSSNYFFCQFFRLRSLYAVFILLVLSVIPREIRGDTGSFFCLSCQIHHY